jgi:hypothetical protein
MADYTNPVAAHGQVCSPNLKPVYWWITPSHGETKCENKDFTEHFSLKLHNKGVRGKNDITKDLSAILAGRSGFFSILRD